MPDFIQALLNNNRDLTVIMSYVSNQLFITIKNTAITMSRKIKKVAVLGSGVMGSGIAAHFANAGLEVLLLDIVPFNLTDEQKKDQAMRNSLVNKAFTAAVKAKKLNGFYDTKYASRITTGNFDDDFEKISDCDWIIEVVIERLDIKKQVFEKVDKFRKAGSLVTSNTSGIPIHLMIDGRSDDFVKHFCGTHFFNPPRYLRLLEIIPTPKTDQAVIDFLMEFGDKNLGKQTVLCKDTPAFIANRVGVYAMAKVFQLTPELGLTIEEVDKLTGPLIGRPKTGTFRLGDLVGHDTSAKVIMGIKENCPNDEQASTFKVLPYFQHLLDNKWYGNKSKKGFYRTERSAEGRKVFALDLETLEYVEKRKVRLDSIGAAKNLDKLADRVRLMYKHEDKGGQLVRQSLTGLFSYVSNRIPEISDDLYSIDHALRAGFAWDVGPFEYWDMIGVEEGVKQAEAAGLPIGDWVKDFIAAGHTSFYKSENGKTLFYHIGSKSYQPVPGADEFILLDNYRTKTPVFKNSGLTAHDLGDGVMGLEFHTKMNAIGGEILEGINRSIEIAEQEGWKGVVIGNNAPNFSVGANIAMIGMLAFQQEWDELNFAVQAFQNTTMRCRYSAIPVVAATQGFTFGGGCETAMHCDKVMAAAETYIGLVEAGVGLVPAGGGTKELALRMSDKFGVGDVHIPSLIETFKAIATATVATSAKQAYQHNLLRAGVDEVVMNTSRNIAEAKKAVLEMADGYTQPIQRNDILALGRTGLGALYTAASSLEFGKYASAHDVKVAKKTAFILCGGDLSAPTKVTEQYLLDLEREAFLSLLGEQKTLERIQHMLQFNKPLRN